MQRPAQRVFKGRAKDGLISGGVGLRKGLRRSQDNIAKIRGRTHAFNSICVICLAYEEWSGCDSGGPGFEHSFQQADMSDS